MNIKWPDTQQAFAFWCQRVLPAVYDSSLSYYELLCKVVDYLNKTMQNVNQLNENGQVMQAEIEELQRLFEKFKTSGFDDYYAARMEQWIRDNAERVIKDMMAIGVFFGLTEDGYFCAYIPDSWSEIEFDTGMNYGTYTYGRLILRYNVDGCGVIDNTGYGEYGEPEPYEALLDRVKKIEQTLYTALEARG